MVNKIKILISGSSGFIGSALTEHLTTTKHTVIPLLRGSLSENHPSWNPEKGLLDFSKTRDIDAIIHLAGSNIANGRWTNRKKQNILNSRVQSTKLLADYFAKADHKPRVLISASAIGIYGNRGDEILTEDSNPGSSFLANVCKQWESATTAASEAGIRVVNIRLGLVLSTTGGVLNQMIHPFKIGLGGTLGNGKQYMSWICLDDVQGAIEHILNDQSIRGPVNLVSPNPVTNGEFTKLLGQTLHRPTPLPVPASGIKIILGEMGEELLLSSTRVKPTKLLNNGYHFRHSLLKQTFKDLFNQK